MKKEFVPYKLALRMKQLGFNEPCLAFYGDENDFSMDSSRKNNPFRKTECTAPLFQQAFRWFREKYELHSFIDCKWKNLGWEFELVDLSKMETISSIDRYNYKTPEETELACLEKLIEIVEQKEK
jgi:hypothetical protein